MAKNKNNKNQIGSEKISTDMSATEQNVAATPAETNDVNIDISKVVVSETVFNEKTGMTEIHSSLGIIIMDAEGNVVGQKRGRPSDPNSDRHKRLQLQAERKAAVEGGELELNKSGDLRGRPVNPNSDRQIRLANTVAGAKQGRPVKADSERQKKIAERLAKLDALKAVVAARGIKPGVSFSSDDLLDDNEA